MDASTTSSPFMRLPIEMREYIYETDEETWGIKTTWVLESNGKGRSISRHPFRLVSKEIGAEYTAYLARTAPIKAAVVIIHIDDFDFHRVKKFLTAVDKHRSGRMSAFNQHGSRELHLHFSVSKSWACNPDAEKIRSWHNWSMKRAKEGNRFYCHVHVKYVEDREATIQIMCGLSDGNGCIGQMQGIVDAFKWWYRFGSDLGAGMQSQQAEFNRLRARAKSCIDDEEDEEAEA